MGRIPFELAEPGTDPTKKKNPVPKKDWTDALPWIFGLIGLLIVGYLMFGEDLGLRDTQAARPTPVAPTERPTATATATTPPIPPVSRSESATGTPTPPPSPNVEIFARGATLVGYNVGDTECWCSVEDKVGWGDNVGICQANRPGDCR